MKRHKNESSGNVLRGFYFSYLSLLIVPLLMGIISYAYTRQITFDQTRRFIETNLTQAVETTETYFDVVNNLARTLNSDRTLMELMNTSSKAGTIYNPRALNALPKISDSQQIVEDYYVFNPTLNVIFSQGRAFVDPNRYYEYCFNSAALSYEQWRTVVTDRAYNFSIFPVQQIIHDGIPKRMLQYIVPYSDIVTGRMTGNIIFYIKESAFTNILRFTGGVEGGFVAVYNPRGEVLLSMGMHAEIPLEWLGGDSGYVGCELDGGGKAQAFYRRSKSSGLLYLALLPHEYLFGQSRDVLNTVTVGMGLMFILAAAFTISLLQLNRTPLEQVVRQLKIAQNKTQIKSPDKGLWQIAQGIVQLTRSNETLRKQIITQNEIFRRSFFNRLRQDFIPDVREVEDTLEHLGVELSGDTFRGVYMRIIRQDYGYSGAKGELEGRDFQRMNIMKALEDYAPYLLFLSLEGEDSFALLFMEYCDRQSAMINTLQAIYQRLKQRYAYETRFYVGTACSSINRVCISFELARSMLRETKAPEELIILVGDGMAETEAYSYYSRDEEKLLNMVASDDRNGISELLRQIYQRNFTQISLIPAMRKLLYYRMTGTLIQLDSVEAFEFELITDIITDAPEAFFARLEGIYHSVCGHVSERRSESKQRLKADIIEYIHGNFCDCALSLSSISLHFNMTETYLSLLIKDMVGANFTNYVERLRIDKANRLLQDSSMPISRIGVEVGYANPNSFSRAYRRIMGVSPSQYRNQ